ncbi:regulatory protein RecX [Sphingobacterium sp. Mn56C]|uniref:regulatory protein RecX n=1 Tax=Sphingobacterium sp. Mn56C TaxID=3395261 RepID=UPI003BE5079D
MEDYPKNKKIFTPHQAKLKAESYCAYQERAQQEVRDKLYDWGLHESQVEQIIAELISDNFLNEERFAKAFALGKFRIKHWGKIKIKQHLKLKRVSDPLIRIALNEIDLDDYEEKILKLITDKLGANTGKLSLLEKSKLLRYMQAKGYESALIFAHLK